MDSLLPIVIACLIGGYIGGTTGFGYGLVVVPVIGVLVDPRTAIFVGLAVGGACSLILAIRQREAFQTRPASVLIVVSVVGMPVGVVVVRQVPEAILHLLIGVAVAVSTVALARGVRVRSRPRALVIAGAISGCLSTSTGLNGPPAVIACGGLGMSVAQVRATSAGVIGAQAGLGLVAGGIGGVFAHQTFAYVVAAAIPTAIGWVSGAYAFGGMRPDTVRRMTYGLLAISAGSSIYVGINSLS